MPVSEKGKPGGESELGEEIVNSLWDMLKREHIQTLKNNNSRLSENPRGPEAEQQRRSTTRGRPQEQRLSSPTGRDRAR